MNTYIFHLGREKQLSIAELNAFFKKPIEVRGDIALLEIELSDPQKTLNQLGGILKISRVVNEPISDLILAQKPSGKICFGLSFFPENKTRLRNELKKIKNELKAAGRNSRFINKDGNLDSATIVKGGLLEDGTDFNFIGGLIGGLVSQTVAVQDFIGYSLRDYEKPARLARAGMLPPKLAQLMINLTGLTQGTLYDPFCGSGTVLGEALIKGMNVIGSDLDETAISAATQNTAWIKQKFKTFGTVTLFEKDAQYIKNADLPQKPDMIVAETLLGPPCHPKMTEGQIRQIQEKLLPLYKNVFTNLKSLLKPGTPLVVAFPLHHVNKKPLPLPYLKENLETAGYKIKEDLTYHRRDQVVGRQIIVFES